MAFGGGVDALYQSANRVVPVLAELGALADDPQKEDLPMVPAVVVVLDGLRVDEVEHLPALAGLEAASAVVLVSVPSLSRPYYHELFTGLPPEATGVRSNKFGGVARADSIPAEVHARGASVAFLTDDLPWFPRLYGGSGDRRIVERKEMLAALPEALRSRDHELTLVHWLGGDETAHQFGLASNEHAEALAMANDIVADADRATRETGAILLVVSDHGHRAAGGHGGDEAEVRRAVLRLRAPGLPNVAVPRVLETREIAPTLAAWMRVAPPNLAVSGAAPELAPVGYSMPPKLAARAALLVQRTAELRRKAHVRGAALSIAVVLFALLGARWLHRNERLSYRVLAIGALWGPIVALAHLYLFHRELTLTGFDDVPHHALRMGTVGVVVALAIAIGLKREISLRRAVVSVGVSVVATTALSFSITGLGLGPWPLAAWVFYAPIAFGLAGACALLALAVASAVEPKSP